MIEVEVPFLSDYQRTAIKELERFRHTKPIRKLMKRLRFSQADCEEALKITRQCYPLKESERKGML